MIVPETCDLMMFMEPSCNLVSCSLEPWSLDQLEPIKVQMLCISRSGHATFVNQTHRFLLGIKLYHVHEFNLIPKETLCLTLNHMHAQTLMFGMDHCITCSCII